jgi:tetratricopeptide (TPR) repeat protein
MSEPGGAREAPTVVLRGGTPPPAGELAPGDRIGDRYTMIRRLGAGGMGTVYEALDRELGISVAVKIVRAPDDEAMRRFKREIQLAREVTHPNVCRIYDLGVDDQGEPAFLTMELLDGETLAARLRRAPLTEAEARPVLAQICAGLDAAHAVGVVHRDLKSANVMLVARAGAVRALLTDFGVALAHTHAGEVAAGAPIAVSSIAGTPAYMAPEQAAGEPATPAADIFSLGVIMVEMLTARTPFASTHRMEDLAGRDVSAARAEVLDLLPERWRAAAVRCLARDPAARFGRAAEVAAAVAPAPRPRRRWLAVAVAAVLASAGVGAWFLASRGSAAGERDVAAELHAAGRDQLRAGTPLDALPLLEQAVAADPGDAMTWATLSAAYHEVGRLADALAAARRGHAAGEGLPWAQALAVEARLHVAESAAGVGDWNRAIQDLETLIDLDPDDIDTSLTLIEACLAADRAIAAQQALDRLRAHLGGRPEPRLELHDAGAAERRG